MAKITYPSVNAKEPVFAVLPASSLSFSRTSVRLCNASEAVAIERYTVVPVLKYLWMVLILVSFLAYLAYRLDLFQKIHV